MITTFTLVLTCYLLLLMVLDRLVGGWLGVCPRLVGDAGDKRAFVRSSVVPLLVVASPFIHQHLSLIHI